MRASLQQVRPTQPGSYEASSVYRNAQKVFKAGESNIIAIELCDDNVRRVRLHKKQLIAGHYTDRPMYVIESFYLDGLAVKQVIGHDYTKTERDSMGAAAVPARTKDVLDFGRLDQSVQSLMSIMTRVQSEGTCTPEQYQAIVNSRAGIIAWRGKAREQMAMAETSIEMVDVMVRTLLDVPE